MILQKRRPWVEFRTGEQYPIVLRLCCSLSVKYAVKYHKSRRLRFFVTYSDSSQQDGNARGCSATPSQIRHSVSDMSESRHIAPDWTLSWADLISF